MPKLWTETIEAHRAAVWQAIVDTTSALAAEHGVRSVTMSQVAEAVGIGRATLYKYFPDVDAILLAWHQHQIAGHLEQLAELAQRPGSPAARLEAVLEAYAFIQYEVRHQGHSPELSAHLHGGSHVTHAEQALTTFVKDLLVEGTLSGDIRDDVAADELATYCLHALAAADNLTSKAAVRRLVTVTMAGLRPLT